MSSITKQDLAREARKLADECEAGTAPPLITGLYWDKQLGCGCAVGTVCVRAGVSVNFPGDISHALLKTEGLSFQERDLLMKVNDSSTNEQRKKAVIVPLLMWADSLDPHQVA